ncbi:MAG: oxidoreductase [Bacteroidota bacterium]
MTPRIWLITGISSGLGKALAETVMKSGDRVIGTFRNQDQADQFNEIHKDQGYAVVLDITDEDRIEHVVKHIHQKFGRIDVLVNNADIGFIGAVEETSLEETRQVFEANVFGTLKLTQTVLPILREQGSGHIVQVSSHGGLKAFAGFGIYNASKFALEGFSEALAQEIEPLGIKLTIVEPGPFRTQFVASGLGEAKMVIDDYNSTAGAFRAKLKGVHGKQEGDPMKAAKAIIAQVNSEHPTLRLPLGKTALMAIGMKLKSVSEDLETHRITALQTIY